MALILSALLAARPAESEAPSATNADEHFDILEYRVLGNSVLPVRVVEAAVYSHLGPGRTFQDVEAARAALEGAYHTAGFGTVFVDIPEQKVEDGIVRLRATEGRLHAVRVAGIRYFSGRQIRAALPAATAGTVPSIPALQAELSATNAATPDRTVVPVLKAGPEPGTVDLDLNVEDRLPLHITAELNNQYSADTKPLRASLTVDYSNLFGRLDDLSAQYQESPQRPRDVGVLAVNYTHRLADGEHLTFSYLDSTSNVATLGALDVIGKGHMFGLHFDDTLIAKPGMLQSFTLGFDYKHFDQTVNAGLGATVPTPISYGLVSLGYLGTVIGAERIWTWSSTAGLILRGVGSDPQDFANKCFDCRQNAVVLRGDGSVSQQLGRGFTVAFKAATQLAADPLVSNEQFVIGGAQTLRGYYEAEELGDLGYRGSLEVHSPNVFGESAFHLRPFAFSDWGRVRFLAPLPGQTDAVRLASYGAGFDLEWKKYLTGNLIWSHAFDPGSATPGGSSRWLFSVKGSW